MLNDHRKSSHGCRRDAGNDRKLTVRIVKLLATSVKVNQQKNTSGEQKEILGRTHN
jgi:hypothetical protein